MATALGVTGAAAYGMLGMGRPSAARAQDAPTPGGTIRIVDGGDAGRGSAGVRLVADGQRGAWQRRAAGPLHHRFHLRALAARELGRQRRRDGVRAAPAAERLLDQRRRLQRRRRDLQPHPLGRAARAGQLDGRAHRDADREEGRGDIRRRRHKGGWHGRPGRAGPRDLRADRRRGREGRRPHGEAQPADLGHLAHSELLPTTLR